MVPPLHSLHCPHMGFILGFNSQDFSCEVTQGVLFVIIGIVIGVTAPSHQLWVVGEAVVLQVGGPGSNPVELV